jgi:hypothetical protein
MLGNSISVLAVAAALLLAAPSSALEKRGSDGMPIPVGTPAPGKSGSSAAGDAYKEIGWDDLIPTGWDLRSILQGLKLDELSDNDPRAAQAMRKVMTLMDQAPVNQAIDGKAVKLAGFVAVIEGDEKAVTEFMLVPYFGACIHVPPPPLNQIVHVLPGEPVPVGMTMFPVVVSGVIQAETKQTDLGSSGYRMKAAMVAPYGG